EDELEEIIVLKSADVQSWAELHTQIIDDLNRLSQIFNRISYWGWVKYQYRQVPKTNFKQAKTAAINAFDACPVNVICRFINQSWCFMSAYHIGLTGKAAVWAVHKQKGHHAVSQSAMMLLDAIVDQNNGN
ncbi:hypothetical protein AN958_01561, partial [Leucoagaricus sp. SymC.cos]